MVLEPCFSSVLHSDDPNSGIPCPAVHAIATIEDTLELCAQESEATVTGPTKVNKWHEKFAKGRVTSKPKD
jgi:sister chromatid cohesion protein DCC1